MTRLKINTVPILAASFFALAASSANAADVYDARNDALADPAPAGVRVNWTGAYVGGAIGYGNANHDLTLNDYFKDYCVEGTNPPENPFEDTIVVDGIPIPARVATVDNVNKYLAANYPSFGPFASCETMSGGSVSVGDIATVAGDSREVANLDGLNSTGIVGDFRLGYDQQMGRFLFGLFGTYGLSNMDADGSVAGVGNFTLERGDDWSAGARAGILVNDSTLLYALAAYTQTEYDLSVTDGANTLSKTTTFDGITVGGGIEFAVTNNVFFGLEGTHTFYDEETIFDAYDADTNVGTSVNDDLGETKVMGTLKIKLNSF